MGNRVVASKEISSQLKTVNNRRKIISFELYRGINCTNVKQIFNVSVVGQLYLEAKIRIQIPHFQFVFRFLRFYINVNVIVKNNSLYKASYSTLFYIVIFLYFFFFFLLYGVIRATLSRFALGVMWPLCFFFLFFARKRHKIQYLAPSSRLPALLFGAHVCI